ncbi:MAG: hypothetical protein NVS3B25_07180 [Hymenobacter sp.]
MSDTPNPKNLYQRMKAVMEDVKRLQKDKQVGSGNYAYKAMSEEKVATTLRTAMIQHGLVIFPIEQHHSLVDYTRAGRGGEATMVSLSTVDVKYKLVNVDNPSEFEIIASSGTGVDPQDKGVGKAMTYSMKYALMRAFLIPTGDDPDDVHNEELARQQQESAQKGIRAAFKSIDEAPDLAALKDVFLRYKEYHSNQSFVAAKDARKIELETPAAA